MIWSEFINSRSDSFLAFSSSFRNPFGNKPGGVSIGSVTRDPPTNDPATAALVDPTGATELAAPPSVTGGYVVARGLQRAVALPSSTKSPPRRVISTWSTGQT